MTTLNRTFPVCNLVNGLRRSTALTRVMATVAMAAGCTFLSSNAYALDPLALPVNPTIVDGGATFDNAVVGTLNVNQSSDRVVIDWDSFNIGGNATTEFFQPGSGSLAVNRVTGGTSPTQILGRLKANGRVMVLDRNGVIFGPSSQIDVGGIIASTGDVDNAAVMSGADQFTLSGFEEGSEVVNRGTITVAEGGLAALVAPSVKNSGVINARLGKVVLAAGDVVTVDLYGDGLFEVASAVKMNKLTVRQAGQIDAEGGVVQMEVGDAKKVMDSVVNMTGITTVASASMQGGKIVLSGGKVNIAGSLDATGTEGGTISVFSDNDTYVRDDASVTTNEGGLIEFHAGNDIRLFGSSGSEEQPLYYWYPSLNSQATLSSGGADINLFADQQVQIVDGHWLDAGGGNILIDNGEALVAESGTIHTSCGGTITINQNVALNDLDKLMGLNTVQAAIDAISNDGSGLNTIYVGAGDWNEDLYISDYNMAALDLIGAQAGVDPVTEERGPESFIRSLYAEYLDHLLVDGFYQDGNYGEAGDGMNAYAVRDVTIQNNFIRNNYDDGIDVSYASLVDINRNDIANTDYEEEYEYEYGSKEISFFYGDYWDWYDYSSDGIHVSDSVPEYYGEGRGLALLEEGDSEFYGPRINIADNNITTYFDHGVNVVNNQYYAYVDVHGNSVTDSYIGMAFEGGLIDLTGDANFLTGGAVGYSFSSSEDDYECYDCNDSFASFEYSPYEYEYDYGIDIDLVDNTIGKTVFTDQEYYFVELLNDALFAPGFPTLEDGSQATYISSFFGGTISPSMAGGIITANELAFLEDMFWHYNDDPNVGLFFFGTVQEVAQSFDESDVFNEDLNNFEPGNGGVGFTLTGLPRVPGAGNPPPGGGNQGGTNPEDLNLISPAAGGEDGNEPTAQELAENEPAAGGDDASCWAQAAAMAGTGQTVNYDFSTDEGDSLLNSADCESSVQ